MTSPLDTRADTAFDSLVRFAGYEPLALKSMARRPGLLPAVLQLVGLTVRGAGLLDEGLRFLVATEASRRAGCRYSAAHAAHAAHRLGVSWERLSALPHAEASGLFEELELAVLAVARGDMGRANVLTDEQRLEVVSVVALFGWFNRWNRLLPQPLEPEPATALHHVAWLAAMPDLSLSQGQRDREDA